MSRLIGVDVAVVESDLVAARTAGLVTMTSTGARRWSLSDQGRVHTERLLAEEVDRLGVRAQLVNTYRRFSAVNGQVLDVCSSWQVIRIGSAMVRNDHSDVDHDAAVLARLDRLHESVTPLVRDLGELSPRFRGYDVRLTMAHDRISRGDTRWLTHPTVDSYHTIWFELHENLLANLGRSRSDGSDD